MIMKRPSVGDNLCILSYGLNIEEFIIPFCISAKDICDTLDVTHEGINQVKESKKNLLIH